MKYMKKYYGLRLIALLCTLVFMMSGISFNASAEEADRNEYAEALEFMRVLGVINADMEFDPSSAVCREDMAVYTAKLIGEKEKDVDCRYFVDVPAGSYGTWAINHLTELGVFSRNEENLFYPEDNVDMDQVYKILTTVLGYERYATAKGGYPLGYRAAAREAEINLADSAGATFENIMIMMYRAVQADIYEPVSFGSETVGMERTGETLLSVYHGMAMAEGTVKAIGNMTMDKGVRLEDDRIAIGDEVYTLDAQLYKPDYLSAYVRFFYTDSDLSEHKIKAIFKAVGKDDINISIDDVESITETSLTYRVGNEKKHTEKLSGMLWIYNGSPLESKLEDTLAGLNTGSIILRDSDDNGSHDTVLVWNYKNFVTGGVNTVTRTIYNALDEGGSFDYNEYETVIVADEKHNEMLWDDISAKSVLSVAEAVDKSVLNIIVSATEFNGTLSNMYENPKRISVNGETYEIEPSYLEEFSDMGVTVGYVYNYKTDAFGKIAYVYSGKSDNPMKFGYIVEATEVYNGLSTDIKIRILNQDGTAEVYEFDEKVRIDGVRIEDSEKIAAAFPSGTGELISPQMIRYELSSDGKIKNVDTLKLNPACETEDNSLTVIGDDTFSVKWYMRNRLAMKAYLDKTNTMVFAIPASPMSERFDIQEYKVGNVGSMLIDDRSIYANVYTASGKSEYSEVVLQKYNYKDLSKNGEWSGIDVILVSEIAEAIDEDGNAVKCIKGMKLGNEVSVNIPGEVTVGDIGKGDLIQLRYGINGQVIPSYTQGESDIILLYDYSKYKGGLPDKSDWPGVTDSVNFYASSTNASYNYYRAALQLSYGKVSEKSENCIWWSYKTLGNRDEVFNVSTVPVVVYDSSAREGQQIYKGTINDIDAYETVGDDCSSIILHTGVGVGKALFVYK